MDTITQGSYVMDPLASTKRALRWIPSYHANSSSSAHRRTHCLASSPHCWSHVTKLLPVSCGRKRSKSFKVWLLDILFLCRPASFLWCSDLDSHMFHMVKSQARVWPKPNWIFLDLYIYLYFVKLLKCQG